jgi:hypothetical protein
MREVSQDVRNYAAMVSMVDRNVGEVLDLLAELDLEDDTLVFFTGDNGGQDRFRSPAHPRGFFGPNVDPRSGAEFRGGKGNLYEGGLRIAMVVRWPGRIRPGRVSDHLWYFPDVMPTLAELAGVPAPADTDGISIVPELLGEAAAGRKQAQHEYLYWELGSQRAVRMGAWKAVRARDNRPWELYDLSRDIEEASDVATGHPEILAKMVAYAKAAHTPAEEGVFHDRTLHEKDRRAKWGNKQPPSRGGRRGKVETLPAKGLIPPAAYKLVRASSESAFNGKLAKNAIDGDPRTVWHTKWQDGAVRHPHELVIDLGSERQIRGFRYLARQDAGWNGALRECEFYIGSDPERVDTLAAKARFEKTRAAQEVKCDPVSGRYVRLRTISAQEHGPWASAAELGVVGK